MGELGTSSGVCGVWGGCGDLTHPALRAPLRGGDFLLVTSKLRYREGSECRSKLAHTPSIPLQGSLRGGVPPPQRGDWGSVPPDPGSAPTRKI